MNTPPLKLAAAQCRAIQGNADKAVDHMSKVLVRADKKKVDIICFPECYLTGYYHDKKAIREHAISLSSYKFQEILSCLKQFKATIIVGIIEERENQIYNSAAVIERGNIKGVYNKIHLNEGKYTPGNQYPVFKKKGITYGINICNDANYSQTAIKLKLKGASLIFYPLNNLLSHPIADQWRGKAEEILINRAKETSCWIVSADVVHQDNEYKSYGSTLIVSPEGEIIKRVAEFTQGVIIT